MTTDPTDPAPDPSRTGDQIEGPDPRSDHQFAGGADGAGGGEARDVGGWAATAGQGLLLARWVAAEVAAQRVEGFARPTWVVGALGLVLVVVGVLELWPLIVLGALLVLAAVAVRVLLALTAWGLRRLALPRRARHLRGEAAAARARLTEALGATGVPVSLGAALRFVVDLARGRRPHAGVAGNLRELAGRLGPVAEVARLRALLAEAAPPPRWLPAGRAGAGDAEPPAAPR